MVRYTSILSAVALSDIQAAHTPPISPTHPTFTNSTQTHSIYAESSVTPSSFTHSTYGKSRESQSNRINVIALGDWGAEMTDDKNDEMVKNQKSVATIMTKWSKRYDVKYVFDVGDSMYPSGVTPLRAGTRMKFSYDIPYKGLHEQNIMWYGCFGNHDVGATRYLCFDDITEETSRPCETADEVIEALDRRVEGQKTYKHPQWHPKEKYHKKRLIKDDLVVDVFFVDMNSVKTTRAASICCQCKSGLVKDNGCQTYDKEALESMQKCKTKSDVVEACIKHLDEWEQASYEMVKEACNSKADHKVVVSHYNVITDMDANKRERWIELFEKCKISLYLNGHTHLMAMDQLGSTTYLTSGNGGGTKLEKDKGRKKMEKAATKNFKLIDSTSFGFIGLSFTKTEITAEFVVVDAGSQDGYKVIETVKIPRIIDEASSSSKSVSNLQSS